MDRILIFKLFCKNVLISLIFLNASSLVQAGKTGPSSRSSSEEPKIQTLYERIKLQPKKIQIQFSENMTLPELLEFNRHANDVFRAAVQAGPALVNMVGTQFYQAIERLFMITQNEDESWKITANELDQNTRDFQIQSLMQVLRALDDHVYFGINEALYQEILERLKRCDCSEKSALETLYKEKDPTHSLWIYIFKVILGQILNHMDKGDRFTRMTLKYRGSTDVLINILTELNFHCNQQKAYKLKIKSLIKNTSKFTVETIDRIRSFAETPRQELYCIPNAFVLYVLEHPGRNTDVLNSFDEGKGLRYSINNMANYIETEDADPNLIKAIFQEASSFIENFKAVIYASYIRSEYEDINKVLALLAEAADFEDEYAKALVYAAYIVSAHADEAIIKEYNMKVIVSKYYGDDL